MVNPRFKMESLNLLDFPNIEVVNASTKSGNENRFKLKINGVKSKSYTIDELFKKAASKKSTNDPCELKALRSLIVKLKDHTTNSSSNLQKFNDLDAKVQRKISRLNSIIKKSDFNVLISAIRDQDAEMVKLILNNEKIDINQETPFDESALSLAIYSNNAAIVKLLLKCKKLDVNKKDRQGETALIPAIRMGNLEIIKLLLEHKIDVNMLDGKGFTPLTHAIRCGLDTEIVELLLNHEKMDVYKEDLYCNTPLMTAMLFGRLEIVELIINQQKFDINKPNNQGLTPLNLAVCNEEIEIMELLLSCKAMDVNKIDNHNSTPLIQAILSQNAEIVKLLLGHEKIDVNLQNKLGDRALLTTAFEGNIEIIKLLLEHEKIDVNQENFEGWTAFMVAKATGNNDLAKLIRTYLKPNDLLIQKERLKLITLAQAAHLKGLSLIHLVGQDVAFNWIDLEGSKLIYSCKKIGHAIKDFSKIHPDLITDDEAIHFQNFVESGLLHSSEEKLAQIKKGLPVIFQSGFKGHIVAVLIFGPYFILCNRGAESEKVVEVHSFTKSKLNVEILNEIKDAGRKDQNAYRELFFKKLPEILEFTPKGQLEKSVERLSEETLSMQTVGNCAWASPEAAIFAYFTLSKPSDKKAIQDKFTTWLSFMQTYSLENYLGVHHLRSNDLTDVGFMPCYAIGYLD